MEFEMRMRTLGVVGLCAAASVGVSGCFTDRVTDKVSGELNGEEFAERFTEIDRQVEAGFAGLVGPLSDRRQIRQPLDDQTSAEAEVAADALDSAAGELDEINPPDDAEEAVDDLAAAATAQADAIRDVLARGDATGLDLFEALEQNSSDDEVDRLRALGYAPPS